MTTVADILSARKSAIELASLPPSATVRQALELMAQREIGSVLLMQGDALLGIFTERDYARRLALQGLASIDTLLAEVMTERLYVVGPHQTVQECLSIMSQAKLRHLPVVEGGQVIGLVSIGDLVQAQLVEQHAIIQQLEHYIAGDLG
ncbi:MAG: CBS domain-containing protein [Burkholderiaceae bacterium]|jgi:CBS domain-containing protein|nr:CBS domain-containing protein [Burkholderiaceae bacterium]